MPDRPRVGVSSCLLGEAVRYDGGHKRTAWIVDVLGPHVTWVPCCPEVAIGLGTPRPPIELRQDADGAVRLRGVEDDRDLTAAMDAWAAQSMPDVDGWILKARSPSCGPGDAEVRDGKGDIVGLDTGRFAGAVMARSPAPVASEDLLSHPFGRATFVRALFRRAGLPVPAGLDAP